MNSRYCGNLLLISFIRNLMFFENEATNVRKIYWSYITELRHNIERHIRWIFIYDRPSNKIQVNWNWLFLDTDSCLHDIVIVCSLRKGNVMSWILIGGISPYPHTLTFPGRRISNVIQGWTLFNINSIKLSIKAQKNEGRSSCYGIWV